MRHEDREENRAVYVAIGIDSQSQQGCFGTLDFSQRRGQVLIAGPHGSEEPRSKRRFSLPGLKGLPQAIKPVFPQVQVHICVVYLINACLDSIDWKNRKAVAMDLRRAIAPTRWSNRAGGQDLSEK